MKIKEKNIKKLIRNALLKEDSRDAYARFIMNMEKLASFSDHAKNMSSWKESKPELYKKVKALGDKLVKKIQGDYPGEINLKDLSAIISLARKAKKESPEIDYGDKVLELANQLWTKDIGESRAGSQFGSADPKARGDAAKNIDRMLKSAWQKEAYQPENKDFWDKFEVWHSIGGIVRNDSNELDSVISFLSSFQKRNPDELSAYGWDGTGDQSDNKKINSGIHSIINSEGDWQNKFHVKLDGNVTFAAAYDITTQWLSFKESEDKTDFEKSGDFNKMLISGGGEGLITGPDDPLLTDRDKYNEIVIKNAKAVAIAIPPKISEIIKTIPTQGISRESKFTLKNYVDLMASGEIKKAADLILDWRIDSTSGVSFGASQDPPIAVKEIRDSIIFSDPSEISKDNLVIRYKKFCEDLSSFNINIYDNITGENITNYLFELENVFKLLFTKNQAIEEKRNMTVGQAILNALSNEGANKTTQSLLINAIKNLPIDVYNSGMFKWAATPQGVQEIEKLMDNLNAPFYQAEKIYSQDEEKINVAKKLGPEYLNVNISQLDFRDFRSLFKGIIPHWMTRNYLAAVIYFYDSYKNYKEIPGIGRINKPANPFLSTTKKEKTDTGLSDNYWFWKRDTTKPKNAGEKFGHYTGKQIIDFYKENPAYVEWVYHEPTGEYFHLPDHPILGNALNKELAINENKIIMSKKDIINLIENML